MVARQRDIEELKKALNFIYPKTDFDHQHIQLANPKIVMELYETKGKRREALPSAVEKIRQELSELIPAVSKTVFDKYNNKWKSLKIEVVSEEVGGRRA